MPLRLAGKSVTEWQVRKIAVIGPGIVGMPMAALLAHAGVREGCEHPADVLVVQRDSSTSGWKVDAINSGKSPIGGIEPDLDEIVAESVAQGRLRATHDVGELRDADVVLVCVQTDKDGLAPDYGPLFSALDGLCAALKEKPPSNVPLVVFESTLAPSSMTTLVRDFFAKHGLMEGRDVLLGNSPSRVMPGRLVERVAASDKILGGLHPVTAELIERIYSHIVTQGALHKTNSLTAEITKTFENAYRDVRIAYTTEIARFSDQHDIDFYAVREAVNKQLAQTDGASGDPNAVPSGGLLVPTVGVGGHCLPKDGILLWWRRLENGSDHRGSLIFEARRINDGSPARTIALAERTFGALERRRVAVLGAAYRFNSEDTRNSPSLVLARLLLDRGCDVSLHDPYVKPDDQNLVALALDGIFSNDLSETVRGAEYVIVCTAHVDYARDGRAALLETASVRGMVDACNLYHSADFSGSRLRYAGIGRGVGAPDPAFTRFVLEGFRVVERGVANELKTLVEFFNECYAADSFNRVDFTEVQYLAGTCVTGCAIADPGPVEAVGYDGFVPDLVRCAAG